MTTLKAIDNSLTRLAQRESEFLATKFLAPVIFGRGVLLSIAGVRCTLRVIPADYRGWGVFSPISHACARAVRVATADERRSYLDLLPAVRLIVVDRAADSLTAISANGGDHRFGISGPAVVNLAFGCDVFDSIVARFDGSQLWFDAMDVSADRGTAAFLRRELGSLTDPARLARAGLSGAHREAFAMRVRNGKRGMRPQKSFAGGNHFDIYSVGVCVSAKSSAKSN
jgi:hypothetical protein